MVNITKTPPSQLGDDIDPLELEDVENGDEELGELAHVEEETPHSEPEEKIVEEEKALNKELDAIALPDVDVDSDIDVTAATPAAKKSSQMVSQELIDRPLRLEDLLDDGQL